MTMSRAIAQESKKLAHFRRIGISSTKFITTLNISPELRYFK
jgi:hypothetical protein